MTTMSTMSTPSSFFFLSLALLALAVRSDAAPSPPAAAPANGPVVLELFTSQGCSSCPPADRLLSKLGSDPKLAGRVIPLAFHVDYWDYIGWHDPFDAPRWSQRQQAYARAFHSNRIYTPQLVVDGHSECVGSEESEVLRRVRDALAAPLRSTTRVQVETMLAGCLDELSRTALNGSSRRGDKVPAGT